MKNANNLKTRLTEMSEKDILGRSKVSLKVAGSSWNKLPAVSSFNLKLSDFNELLHSIGLERRLPNEIKVGGHSNHRMNKYAKHIIKRMRRAIEKGDTRKFWHIAWRMIEHSVTFRVMAINHISKNWYKNKPLSYVMNIVKKTDRIIKEKLTEIDFKRVYIPKKPEDAEKLAELLQVKKLFEISRKEINWRGLGVPEESWRIYLHMVSNFMTLFLEGKLMPTQHAYQPGRGTTTAMADVLDRVKRYKYIYEIDFKGCFPNINLKGIIDKLLDLGMHYKDVLYLEQLNLSSPKKAKFDLMDEWAEDAKRTANKWIKRHGSTCWVKEKVKGKDQWVPLFRPTGEVRRMSHVGLPQGSPLSPILTILGLDDWTRSAGEDRVFYADDGIIFSNSPIELNSDPHMGINIHEGKSGYVKKNGIWLKPLYFVGMLYNGWSDSISGHTRNGSRLNIEKESENLFELLRKIKPDYEWNIKEVFRNTSLGGVITACLYNGQWGKVQADVPDPESLFGIKGSWIDLKGRTAQKAQTSSDAVRALAQIIRNKWSTPEKKKSNRVPKKLVFINGRWLYINKLTGTKPVSVILRSTGTWMRLNPCHK
jgi:hypothetical protein